MLRHLSIQHQVTLVSFVRPSDDPASIEHLRQFCERVLTVSIARSLWKNATAMVKSLINRQPAVILRDWTKEMGELLRRLVHETRYGVIHADQTAMAQYALYARENSPGMPKPFTILDEHNALYKVVKRQADFEGQFRQALWHREADRLAEYEAVLCRHFDHILTVTTEDKSALLSLFSDSEIDQISLKMKSIPICVDPDSQPAIMRQDNGVNILHLGTMFWPPNYEGVLWFARSVFPLIVKKVPRAHFIVAGKDPPSTVQELARPGSPLCDQIEVTGFISDPTNYVARSQVFIVPLRAGGGMRVKILTAWLWGIPIVSTTVGAEGICIRPGENIIIADEPEDFAQAVIRILMDKSLANRLSDHGRAWVEANYNWKTVYPAIDEVYAQLTI